MSGEAIAVIGAGNLPHRFEACQQSSVQFYFASLHIMQATDMEPTKNKSENQRAPNE